VLLGGVTVERRAVTGTCTLGPKGHVFPATSISTGRVRGAPVLLKFQGDVEDGTSKLPEADRELVPVHKLNCRGVSGLHAIGATPARWRGGVGSHPTYRLICAQARPGSLSCSPGPNYFLYLQRFLRCECLALGAGDDRPGARAGRRLLLHGVIRGNLCGNQMSLRISSHGGIMTFTPSTRRLVDFYTGSAFYGVATGATCAVGCPMRGEAVRCWCLRYRRRALLRRLTSQMGFHDVPRERHRRPT